MTTPMTLPVTTLPPLHIRQQGFQSASEEGGSNCSTLHLVSQGKELEDSCDAVVEAYASLVSLIVGFDEHDEEGGLCISYNRKDQTSALVVRLSSRDVVALDGPIPSDFSLSILSHSKNASKMHLVVVPGSDELYLHLYATASLVPQAALSSLAKTLERMLRQDGSSSSQQHPQPSLLNFPHKSRPVPFSSQPDTTSSFLLHQWFERRRKEDGSRVAIDYLDYGAVRRRYTYAHLSSSSNLLASRLLQVSPGQAHKRVAVLMGPSPELYSSYLACLKSGYAFCPIPVDAPAERQRVILADLEPAFILTNNDTLHFLDSLPDWPWKNISDILNGDEHWEGDDVDLAEEDDVAYIMYTSGTTGKPKGVTITHLSAACSIAAHLAVAPMSTGTPTRWFQFAAPTFDPSIMEIFVVFSSGSTLCSAQRQLTLQDINTVVDEMHVDVLMATPSLATLLDPTKVKALWTMGEALNASVLANFAQHNPEDADVSHGPRGMYNAYGPTEAAINCTLQCHVPAWQRGTVLGKPLPSCTLVVVATGTVDAVPMGCVGELLITGPQVSTLGYLNRPEETAKAFVNQTSWGRAYRTGDRARVVWDEHGEAVIEYLGRLSDDQVKLSGRRVELGEIDTMLAKEVEGVRESISCIWKPATQGQGSEKVVTLVSLRQGSLWTVVEAECRQASARHLPGYMHPFKLLHLQELPRSAAGKLDRKASTRYVDGVLQSTADDKGAEEIAPILPSLPPGLARVEATLLTILSDVLGRPIAPTTALVEAGIDSLRAMRFLREVRRQSIEVQVTMAQLLNDGCNVRSLVNSGKQDLEDDGQVDERLARFAEQHAGTQSGYLEAETEMVLPTTATQSGMITSLARSSRLDAKTYINHSIYTLADNISPTLLFKAFQEVVAEQPIYRTAIVPVEDDLAPFAQLVLTRQAAKDRGFINVIYRNDTAESSEKWTRWAEDYIELKAQRLYCIQVVGNLGDRSGYVVASFAHAIFDGASLEVLMCDVARRFAGLTSRPLRCGIKEAVHTHYRSRSRATDDYWLAHTDDFQYDGMPVLSGNVEKGTKQSFEAVQHLGQLTFDELNAGSRQFGSTALGVLQTAWSILLAAYSEADTGDVMFGSVVTGDLATTCHAPTFSTLPSRVRLDATAKVETMARELTKATLRAQSMAHPSYGLIKTADGKLPYDTLLALQQYPPEESEEYALPWTSIQYPAMANDFAMLVEIWPSHPHLPRRGTTDTAIVFKATFDSRLFSTTSALTIMQQLASLTSAILASPQCAPSELLASLPSSLLSADGRVSPPTTSQGVQPRLLHSQFEERVKTRPNDLALSFAHRINPHGRPEATEWSYVELDRRANNLASLIVDACGEELHDQAIPISLGRSPELYVAVLAILKAGAAWCPIDTAFPVDRKRSLIARCKSPILLTSRADSALAASCLAKGSSLLHVEDAYEGNCKTLTPRSTQPNNLAYVIWTSGTTGEPKGVMVEHLAAAEAMSALQESIAHGTGVPRVLQFSAFSFDVFVQDLFYTWGLGGVVVGATREVMLGSFVALVWAMKPTHAHLTPSFGASVATEELRNSSLQVVTMIGEKLTEAVAEAWASITTTAYNTYGPAENAVVSTLRQFTGRKRDMAKAANVGLPMAPVTAYVVDAGNQQQLVPKYAVGELALGGNQVARGYLDEAEKTASRFLWNGQVGERIYLTGDLVRRVDHGIEFLGRNDDLVKLSGIRVELSEISATCAKADGHAVEHVETLLLARRERQDVKVVVAFVSLRVGYGGEVDRVKATVRQWAKGHLPAYMVPGLVIVMKAMPRTASAKVDRKALQAIYLSCDGQDDQPETDGDEEREVWSPTEETILAMVGRMVGAENVSRMRRADQLASLGLNSISIIKLAWQLKKQLSIQVIVMDLVACETLGELLTTVGTGRDAEREEEAGGSWLDDVEDQIALRFGSSHPHSSRLLPATAMQESLVVETMRDPRSYWSHRMWKLRPGTDLDRLKAAWKVAVDEHDILRASFVPLAELDGAAVEWSRSVGLSAAIYLSVAPSAGPVQWSEGGLEEVDEVALRERLAHQPGALGVYPWSLSLLKCKEGGLIQMVSMHHALHDAWSFDRVMQTVQTAYSGQQTDKSDSKQFVDALGRGLLPSREEQEQAQTWWAQQFSRLRNDLGTFTSPSFPDLTQSRQKQEKRILRAGCAFELLEAGSGLGGASPSMVFQAAFGCVVAEYLELEAVVMGQTISQRMLDDRLAEVVGPAIVTIPFIARLDYSSRQLLQELAWQSSKLSLALHVHPSALRRALGGSSQSLYPGLFVFHPDSSHAASTLPLFADELEDVVGLRVEHALAFNVFESRLGYSFELSGDNHVLSQSQLQLMLDQIVGQIRAMLQHPDKRLSELNNVLPPPLASISVDNGLEGDETDYPPDSSSDVTAWIKHHARHHPDWVAAEEADVEAETHQSCTYAQLDSAANQIIARLIGERVLPGSVVALHMSRTLVSLAATVAIFKAGYVYLPVDEELPSARQELLIKDANAAALLTSADMDVASLQGQPTLVLDHSVFQQQGDGQSQEVVGLPTSDGQLGGYILYTSGSTGVPKGVCVSAKNLCSFVHSFTRRMMQGSPQSAQLAGRGKYLNLASRAFDPHLTQMFAAWRLGYSAVIGPRMAMLSNLELVINDYGITHFGSVPSVLLQLRLSPNDVPSVRVVTTGGEKASNELLDMWTKEAEVPPLVMNVYGPTECTIGCVSNVVDLDSNARNIGLPLDVARAVILLPGDVVAKKGQPGELCIAGDLVTQGYLGRPEEQAKAFGQTDVLTVDGAPSRIYQTGDVMRMMADGRLEFLGRKDQQAKVRGQRLELGEVVSFLKTASGSDQFQFAATVVEREGVPNAQLFVLCAHKSDSGDEPSNVAIRSNLSEEEEDATEALLQACSDRLPAYMVPHHLIWVNRIPHQTASGKVDVKQLNSVITQAPLSLITPRSDSEGETATQTRERTEEETAVAEAVAIVVGAESTGMRPEQTIYELGIDSLSAVHLAALLRQRGFAVRMTDVLTRSTIANLAQCRAAEEAMDSAQKAEKMQREVAAFEQTHLAHVLLKTGRKGGEIERVLPTLPLQSALVAHSIAALDDVGEEIPYVSHFAYQLGPNVDTSRWRRAVEEVIRQEAMLKTSFVQLDDGMVVQVVLKEHDGVWTDGVSSAQVVSAMHCLPPIRVRERHGEVVLSIHHALFDGQAMDAIREEIQERYNCDRLSPSHSLHMLSTLAHHCHSLDIDAARQFWQDSLRGTRPCHVMDDSAPSAGPARSTLQLTSSANELKEKAKERGLTLQAVMETAMTMLLARHTGSNDVVYGLVVSLRALLESVVSGLDSFVGPCLNTLVKRALLQPTDSANQVALGIRDHHAHCLSDGNALVPVERVQRWAESEDRLFDAILSVNIHSDQQTDKGQVMSSVGTTSNSELPLAVDVDVSVGVTITMSSSFMGADQLSSLCSHFARFCLSTVEEHPIKVDSLLPGLLYTASSAPCTTAEHDGDKRALNDEEKVVRDALCKLLNLDSAHVTPSSSLYQLGLDSILVLTLSRMIKEESGVKVGPIAVLRARTVQAIGKLISAGKGVDDQQQQAGVVEREIEYEGTVATLVKEVDGVDDSQRQLAYLVTPIQEGMLSAASALTLGAEGPGRQPYTYEHRLDLSDEACRLDPNRDLFKAAWDHLVGQVEILRTTFYPTSDDRHPWLAIVHNTYTAKYSGREGVVDLAKSPAVWNVGPTTRRATLTMHHALYDGASLPVLWSAFASEYSARLKKAIQASTPSYPPFSAFAKMAATHQDRSVEFWSQLVRGYRYVPMEVEEGRVETRHQVVKLLSPAATDEVRSRCRESKVTLQTVLMFTWARVLADNVLGQTDVVFGQVLGGRAQEAGEVIGPTMNTVPIRISLQGRLDRILDSIQRLSEDSQQHQVASLRQIHNRWREQGESEGPAGLFESLFVFDQASHSGTNVEREEAEGRLWDHVTEPTAAEGGFSEYPLVISMGVKQGGLQVRVSASSLHAEPELVESLARTFQTLLEASETPALESVASSVGKKLTRSRAPPPLSIEQQSVAEIIIAVAKSMLEGKKPVEVGVATSLLSVGLDSISAIRLSSLLRRQGLLLSVVDIMRSPVVANLALKAKKMEKGPERSEQEDIKDLVSMQQRQAASRGLGVQGAEVESVLPCLAGQEMHLQYWLFGGQRFFEPAWVYEVEADGETVENAWIQLQHRHSILRSTFVLVGSRLLQVAFKSPQKNTFQSTIDTATPVDELVERQVDIENGRPSSLTRPAVHLHFLAGSQRSAVVLRLHHSLYDAWSIKAIVRDLGQLINGAQLSRTPSLDWAVGRVMSLRDMGAEKDWWQAYLSQGKRTILSSGSPSDDGSPLGPQHLIRFPEITPLSTLQDLSKACPSTAASSSVLLVAFAKTLKAWSGVDQPMFGFYHAARSLSSHREDGTTVDLTDVVLPTLSLTPMTINLATERPLADQMASVQDRLAQLSVYGQTSLSEIASQPLWNAHINLLFRGAQGQGIVQTEGALQRMRLPLALSNAYFTSQPAHDHQTPIDGLRTDYIASQRIFVDVVVDATKGVSLAIRCDQSLFSPEEIKHFANDFAASIGATIEEMQK